MMNDGLRSGEEKSEKVDSFNVSLTGSIAVTGAVSGASTGTFSSVLAGAKTLSAVGTGSPSITWGKQVEAGVGALGTGSNAWHVFASAFSAAPTSVVASNYQVAGDWINVGSIGAGSFYVEGKTASKVFTWVAVQ